VPHNDLQVVYSQLREHSRKPDEVKDRIVKLMGDLPRLELFARRKTDGWDVFGNEVESTIVLTATG
jgi:site-specific DNA-methyltransferase (adenine-specific)